MTTDLEVEEFLEHFGVKGMHWGIRNDKKPSAKTVARRETKAAKYDKKAADLTKEIQRIAAARPEQGRLRLKANRQIVELDAKRTQAQKDAARKREGKLTDHQRKVVKGTAVVGAVLAAYGTYTMAQSGELNRKVLQGKAFIKRDPGSPWKMNPDLARKDMGAEDILHSVVSRVNPDYGDIGTKQNCRRATFAYEMRRRGYDVAATRTTNASGQTAVGVYNATRPGEDILPTGRIRTLTRMVSEKARKEKDASIKTPVNDALSMFKGGQGKNPIEMHTGVGEGILEHLSKQPDGARGELGVNWLPGGGHSMAWEKIKGKAVIFDAQNGKMYDTAEAINKDWGYAVKDAAETRLDNVPLNHDYLRRWLKDA